MEGYSSIIMIVLLFVVFYFFLIRPEQIPEGKEEIASLLDGVAR